MTVQKLIDMLNRIPDKNLIVEVECWGEGSVPATDVSIMDHDEPEYHVDDNGDDIKFTDYVLIDGQWGVKDAPQIGVSTNYVERHPDIYDQIKQLTTKNDLGVDCIDRKAIEKHIEDGLNSSKYGHDAVNIMTEIHFMPSVTPQLSVPEVTALTEWTTKLTKASEDAYNKGYADGMKAQEPKTGHWIKSNIGGAKVCSVCQAHMGLSNFKYCPNCGAKMKSEVEDDTD